MLRLTGALALAASVALAVFLGSHFNSAHARGRVVRVDDHPGYSTVLLDEPLEAGSLTFYPVFAPQGMEPIRSVTFEGPDLPAGIPVELEFRQVRIWRPLWIFSAVSIRSETRTWSHARSLPAFTGVLGLIVATPLLLWSAAALPVVLLSRKPDPRLPGIRGT